MRLASCVCEFRQGSSGRFPLVEFFHLVMQSRADVIDLTAAAGFSHLVMQSRAAVIDLTEAAGLLDIEGTSLVFLRTRCF